ncbi:MAG: dTMP kinase [Deferribacteraceae bacterium]|jgi:dTMP kinase|nr:dTMP kinase [Deferribacteraceae bacterium]
MADLKPLFIVIDGIDGTGKTTQVRFLTEWLQKTGREAESTQEPGGTAAGAVIRSILVNKNMTLDPNAELLLFCADRVDHMQKINSKLNSGISVVSDRFLPSTWAYQIFGRKLQPGLLEAVILHTVHIFPDLTIILDMDIDTALARAGERLAKDEKTITEGRFESEKRDFFSDVQKGFRWYVTQERFGKSVIIDASGKTDEVAGKIQKACSEVICKHHMD